MTGSSAIERAARAAALGHGARITQEQQAELEALVCTDADARVRSAALSALVRSVPQRAAVATWRIAALDSDRSVRRRAAELAPALGSAASAQAVLALLHDDEPLVAEAAAFALGERAQPSPRVIAALSRAAGSHDDPLVREAAVAAIGAIGEPSTLPVVLAACDDKPAVRRRAVLALAAFDGPEVEARLTTALTDRDWQVRQAAVDLLGNPETEAPTDDPIEPA
jgi:HEAT repeat protein